MTGERKERAMESDEDEKQESPVVTPVVESIPEEKKKTKQEKLKRCNRTVAGTCWEDPSLLESDPDDFQIFCGDMGNEPVPLLSEGQDDLGQAAGKMKGYGFISFKDPNDYVRAMQEMNGKYAGSQPIKLCKSMWKEGHCAQEAKSLIAFKCLGQRPRAADFYAARVTYVSVCQQNCLVQPGQELSGNRSCIQLCLSCLPAAYHDYYFWFFYLMYYTNGREPM
ncbi:hypothetical protein JRQ81_010560 [Phrynocephalus forsythii]|uniref:RRM domain-containing protein n=1 Tax=Phrynocephalus forsythii TaxID=171643 RepID=A0A9Q1B4I3_9SAUR|nr:hypothetical protein JRQ81_010560 [Phrynocephalus forsythii]